MGKHLCRARYLAHLYPEIDTRCGQPFAHTGEHKTRRMIPVTIDEVTNLKLVTWFDVIEIAKTDEGMIAKCDCRWTEGPSTKVIELGKKAFAHAEATGHHLR